jgi:probable rRNA maturation factor
MAAALRLSVQGKLPCSRYRLRRWVLCATEQNLNLNIRFSSTLEMRQLNAQYRAKDYATNVLTFQYPSAPFGGKEQILSADVILCMAVIRREAKAQNKTLLNHLAHMVVHATLHAQGHDHIAPKQARAMEALEIKLLSDFRITDPYSSH